MKALWSLTLLIALSPLAAQDRPNILFIISDDLATRAGCYGDEAAITPNLDRLAGSGVTFERAYVQGTVCTPSRTSFMLGLNNRNAKRNHFIQNPGTLTMGRYFRQNGYQTFSVGKIDHTEEFGDPEAWDIRAKLAYDHGVTPLQTIREEGGGERLVSRYAIEETPEENRDWLVATRAVEFLQNERDRERPFFAAVGFYKPHQPSVSTPEHVEAHSDLSKFSLTETPDDATPLTPGSLREEPGIAISAEKQRLIHQYYYASVSFMDEQLGRVLDALEGEGLTDSTLIVFTSDHGYHLGWRGQYAKHDLSEEVMRVPLVASWPGITPPGARADGIVELLDLFPTFANASGLPIPETLDGKSFLPQLKNPDAPGKRAAFCDDGPKGRTIRTPNWRLTQRRDGAHELYHLPGDPGEFYNVYGDHAHAGVVARLEAMLDKELGELPPLPKRLQQQAKADQPEVAHASSPAGSTPPNFLFILADDLAWSGTAVAMHPDLPETSRNGWIDTPALQRLAEEGVRFSDAYSPAPICTPTRRSIVCGMTVARQRGAEFRSLFDPSKHVTIPGALKQANASYRTAHFGKWGEAMVATPEQCGYDVSDGETGNVTGDSTDPDDPKLTGSVSERAAEFIRESTETGKPFFAQVSYYAVHLATQAHAETIAKYESKGRPPRSAPADFSAMLEDMDSGIALMLDALDELNIADNTWVIFSADNGGREFEKRAARYNEKLRLETRTARQGRNQPPEFAAEYTIRLPDNEPLRGSKQMLYEGGIRVPFIVRGPGVNPGSFHRQPVALYDLLPTVYELAGGVRPLPDSVDGSSLAAAFHGKPLQDAERISPGLVFHRPRPLNDTGEGYSSLRHRDYKLLVAWTPEGEVKRRELYHLRHDLSEQRDLSMEDPGRTERLFKKLTDYLAEVDAETPTQIPGTVPRD